MTIITAATQVAYRTRVIFCQQCDAFHVLLYAESSNGNDEPFAMCTLSSDAVCDLIDDEVGETVEHHG